MNIQHLESIKSDIEKLIAEAFFLIKDEALNLSDDSGKIQVSGLSILRYVTERYKELNKDG